MASYLAGVDEPEVRAQRMADLENRILPACKENLGWPDNVSIDLDSIRRSLTRRRR